MSATPSPSRRPSPSTGPSRRSTAPSRGTGRSRSTGPIRVIAPLTAGPSLACHMPGFTSPLAEQLADDVLERFLRYVRVDTRSQLDRTQSPSTPGQLDLAKILLEELHEIGLEDAELDDNGYVFATLPGEGPVIGLLAHVDTSPECSGSGVEPLVHREYDGQPIALPKDGVVIDTPQLRAKAGEDLVTASGDTLLGADDKA